MDIHFRMADPPPRPILPEVASEDSTLSSNFAISRHDNMAAPRLPFLWPTLFQPTKSSRVGASITKERASPSVSRTRQARRHITTSPRRSEPPITQRYGKAYEHAAPALDQEPPKEPQEKEPVSNEKPPQDPVHEHEEVEEDAPTATTSPNTPTKQAQQKKPPHQQRRRLTLPRRAIRNPSTAFCTVPPPLKKSRIRHRT